MSVVGRRADPAVAMDEALMLDGFRKPFGEFRTVVGLDGLEFKRSDALGLADESSAQKTIGLRYRPGTGPAGVNINQRVSRESIARLAVVHRIDLHETAGKKRHDVRRILVPLLPFGESGAVVSLENSFDARHAD